MLPPPTLGFPRLLRKKADWGDWVVSPVWIVMELVAKGMLLERVGEFNPRNSRICSRFRIPGRVRAGGEQKK